MQGARVTWFQRNRHYLNELFQEIEIFLRCNVRRRDPQMQRYASYVIWDGPVPEDDIWQPVVKANLLIRANSEYFEVIAPVTFQASNQHADFFTTNKTVLLAETRVVDTLPRWKRKVVSYRKRIRNLLKRVR